MTTYRRQTLFLLILDTFCLVAAFDVMFRLRGFNPGVIPLSGDLWTPLLFLLLALYLIDGYDLRTDMLSADYMSQHLIAQVVAATATLLLTFVFIPAGNLLQTSRIVIPLSFLALAPVSLVYRRWIYQRYAVKRGQRSLVFLGDRESCEAFRDECRRAGTSQPVVYTVVSEQSAVPFDEDSVKLQPFAEVIDRVKRGELTAEAIVLRESGRELLPEIAERLESLYFSGVPTYTLELFHQVYWRKIPLYRINQTWLFQEGFQIAREPVFERLKRVSDIVLSLIGLIVSLPVVLACALAIRIDDGGPVFFRQVRIGRNRRPFTAVKLRTMTASGQSGDPYTRAGDARITRVGRLLRSFRLDEIPQLWNVLKGEMSLIGPRAEWDRLVGEYERRIPCYNFRHLVKPGITGWAQVNYRYGTGVEDTIRKLEYDLYYIRHFSFTLDASIVLKTIHVMLFGKGR